ncbi:endoglucanase V-like protein [Lactarius quietus]|nr:endoglucanase V-like protein [Lactarius quietus]
MKSASIFIIISLLAAAVRGSVLEVERRATDGYVQNPSGTASFTYYSGCGSPACGKTASGFTAAMNQLTYGAPPGAGEGDACGRCFKVTGTKDPYDTSYTGPSQRHRKDHRSVSHLGNQVWCGQTLADPVNQHGMPVHFDLCQDTGASAAFFPSGHGALTGYYEEVSCTEWSGTDGSSLWNGACLASSTAPLWPSTACGNQGTAP